jgi:hypothetical protein
LAALYLCRLVDVSGHTLVLTFDCSKDLGLLSVYCTPLGPMVYIAEHISQIFVHVLVATILDAVEYLLFTSGQ